VIIETLGIFGTEFRDVGSDTTSDVTATSSLGREFDGIVDINTPDIDPSRGLVELDEELVDIASLINEDSLPSCGRESVCELREKVAFPQNPSDPLTPQQGWEDLNLSEMDNQEVFPGQPESENYQNSVNDHNADNATLQEASGWEVDSEGNLVLTGETPISGNHSRSSNCAGISSKNLSIGKSIQVRFPK
jgi:large exoprotein involved in heme utilization and adhesion